MNLRAEREAAGLTQAQAARMLGVGISTVQRYENDTAKRNATKRKDYELVQRMRQLYAERTAELGAVAV